MFHAQVAWGAPRSFCLLGLSQKLTHYANLLWPMLQGGPSGLGVCQGGWGLPLQTFGTQVGVADADR